ELVQGIHVVQRTRVVGYRGSEHALVEPCGGEASPCPGRPEVDAGVTQLVNERERRIRTRDDVDLFGVQRQQDAEGIVRAAGRRPGAPWRAGGLLPAASPSLHTPPPRLPRR